ncbi:Protein kinase-like domain [Penicillium roqueforti FM164]|uniref:Protein kinase-like domain n=1 Tax=Penicillium roqueforti (strain FM164) TaxID=1365484 RepID=W6PV88_PENRF|nr:Protein kinase-like domain [Penicillium roqueforti FM164]
MSSVPIRNSVTKISDSIWRLGCTIECNRTAEPDDTCAAAWKDGEDWYILRHTTSEQLPDATSANSPVRLIHEGESETIKFVQDKAPQVPVPEVIYSWVDGNRSFLVLKRVPGITLRDAWETMSATEQDSILDEVVHIVRALPGSLETGFIGAVECLSVRHFFREDLHPNPEIEERFHLYHPDLAPGNIIVSNQKLLAIINWESAGFYPRFWISTKPSISRGMNFHPPIPGIEETEWRKRLRVKLEEHGYPRFADWFMEWMRTKSR